MFKLTTKQKLTLFFIVVLVTGLISINVFMFYYMEARRLENEKNSFKAKNVIDLKASTTTTTEKLFCEHNTVWIGDGECEDFLNIKDCNYDGGDCCLSPDKVEIILKEREVAFLSPSNIPSTFEFFYCAPKKFKC